MDILLIPLFIGTGELLLIGGLALLLFGGKKLPEMMRGLGQGVRQFKEGMKDVQDAINKEGDVEEKTATEQKGQDEKA